jgi:hypothetical protein
MGMRGFFRTGGIGLNLVATLLVTMLVYFGGHLSLP